MSAQQKAEVRRLRQADLGRTRWPDWKLAAKFGVSRSTVQRATQGNPYPSEVRQTPVPEPDNLRKDAGMEDRTIRDRQERDRWAALQRKRDLAFATALKSATLTLEQAGTWERHMFDALLASQDPRMDDIRARSTALEQFIEARYALPRLRSCVPKLPLWCEVLEDDRARRQKKHVTRWRALLTKHVEGRELLREVLTGPLRFTPEGRTYRFEGGKSRRAAARRDSRLTNCSGVPNGIRTRVLALKGPRPGPLDDGDRKREPQIIA